jgi:hypothetical protein
LALRGRPAATTDTVSIMASQRPASWRGVHGSEKRPWHARHVRRGRRSVPIAARTAGIALVVWLVFVVAAQPASAAITNVQAGTFVSQAGVTSVTPTLASASTAGDLLVALIDTAANTTVTGPAGWTKAQSVYAAGVGSTQIWYRANTVAGVTSVAFTLSASDTVVAQLSEWSGVAAVTPLNGSGSATKTTSSTTLAVSATAAAPNELAIASFNTAAANTFTPASGWTNLLPASANFATGDYKIGVGSGAVSETETASTATTWAGVTATFYGSCGGGSLALTPPATAPFGSLTLNGTNQTATQNVAFSPSDATGSGVGWNLTGTSTTFTNGGGKTLPTTATTITAGSSAVAAGTCRLPTNSISYPVTLPAAAVAPKAVKLYNAAAATGLGTATSTLTFKLAIGPNSYNGTYNSTWTFTLASGP